ncbi:MAG: HIT family protein [Flavobacteriales bacterium]|jgi:histidine triad (HIT) family protein
MASIFSRIVSGELPAYILAEDDLHMAILDINPLVQGHVLVFPKKEVDYLFDLDEESYQSLMHFTKSVAIRLKELVPCIRIGVSVIGLEVPHVHIHLIPMNTVHDMNFSRQKLSLDIPMAQLLFSKFKS